MYLTVYSTNNAPVVIDDDGRMVHPQEFACVKDSPQVQAALAAGELHDVYDRITKKGSTPEVWAVRVETDRANAGSKEAPPVPVRTIKSDAAE